MWLPTHLNFLPSDSWDRFSISTPNFDVPTTTPPGSSVHRKSGSGYPPTQWQVSCSMNDLGDISAQHTRSDKGGAAKHHRGERAYSQMPRSARGCVYAEPGEQRRRWYTWLSSWHQLRPDNSQVSSAAVPSLRPGASFIFVFLTNGVWLYYMFKLTK